MAFVIIPSEQVMGDGEILRLSPSIFRDGNLQAPQPLLSDPDVEDVHPRWRIVKRWKINENVPVTTFQSEELGWILDLVGWDWSVDLNGEPVRTWVTAYS